MIAKVFEWRVSRFIVAGGFVALFEYVMYALIYLGSDNPVVSQVGSYLMALCVSFIINKFWVFKAKGANKESLIKYVFLAVLNSILGALLTYLMIEQLSLNPFVVKILLMILIATWNYVILSKYIFSFNPDKSKV